MIQIIRRFTGVVFILALMLVCSDAMAGTGIGSVSYLPVSSAIPTLSGAMLVVLSLLFAVIAFRVLRARSADKPLASIAAIGILTLGASSGIHLMRSAQAAVAPIPFDLPNGGFVYVQGGFNDIVNHTGLPQRITNIVLDSGYYIDSPPPSSPECTIGMVVPNLGHCYLNIFLD